MPFHNKGIKKQIEVKNFYTYYNQQIYDFSGHRHHFWEMNVILSGERTLCTENAEYVLKEGMMCLIRPDAFHSFKSGANGAKAIILTFDADIDIGTSAFILSKESMTLISLFSSQIEREFSNNSFNDSVSSVSQIIKTLFESFLLNAFEYDAELSRKEKSTDIFEKAVDFMKSNVYLKISVNDIANVCSVSASTLKNVFRSHTGMGAMTYFRNMKIEHAKKLLAEGESVNAISEALSFSSAAHFSLVFKNVTNLSPLQYKKLIKGK